MTATHLTDPSITIQHATALLMRENACGSESAARTLKECAREHGLTELEVASAIVDLAPPWTRSAIGDGEWVRPEDL